MKSSFFNFDDILFTKDVVIVSKDKRRIILIDLSVGDVEILQKISPGHELPTNCSPRLVRALNAKSLLDPSPASRRELSAVIPARLVMTVARPLSSLTSIKVLAATLVATSVAWLVHASANTAPLPSLSFQQNCVALLAFALTLLVHELGHATACYRITGLAGHIRLKIHMGLPALAVDVTPVQLGNRQSRILAASAGPIWQLGASGALLASGRPELITAANYSAMLGLGALLPLPSLDGFKILSLATQSTLRGPLRPPRSGDLINPIYCIILACSCSLSMELFTALILHDIFSIVSYRSTINMKYITECVLDVTTHSSLLAFSVSCLKFAMRDDKGFLT